MSKENYRVRFAPSPTGPLHIGGVRTALFNYLFAKKTGGTFILRIEDTDRSRFVPGAEEYIRESLEWCNIPYDEGPGKDGGYGPYKQSERQHLYKDYAEQLIESGNAYYAFDTPESLEKHRKDHEAKEKTFIYNWHNREKLENSLSLPTEEVEKRKKEGVPYVIRFKVPIATSIELKDEIRGKMTVDTKVLDDKVLFKSDGMPTYHLANIVDDHLMKITHVIRGEEWLPSLPLHKLLYDAFEWSTPHFAHLPLILKPQGKGKLSKRDGDKMGFPVFPLEWKDPTTNEISSGYREEGYFPEAVINMLALLGWNEGDGSEKEFYALQELKNAFSLEHVSKGGSKFDPEKTKWFQHHYLQEASNEELSKNFQKFLQKKDFNFSHEYVSTVINLLKERATFVHDFWELGNYFFIVPENYEPKAVKKAWKEETPQLLQRLIKELETVDHFDSVSLQDKVKGWIKKNDIGFGKVMQPFRISLVGAMQGPDIFEIAAAIGKEETIARLHKAVNELPT